MSYKIMVVASVAPEVPGSTASVPPLEGSGTPGPLAVATPDQFASWVGVLSWEPRVGRCLLQPPIGEGEPLSETTIVSDRVGGHSY